MAVVCSDCNGEFSPGAKYCTKCGRAINKNTNETKAQSLNLIIVFYILFLLYAVLAYIFYSEYPVSLSTEITIESIFALLVIGFSVIDYKGILKLYTLPKVNWKILAFTIIFPCFTAFGVTLIFGYVNDFLFEGQMENYYSDYLYLDHPLFWAILFIAITPPLFEELAFRGFLFNQLGKVTSRKITILATAFIFALVHFSFISLIWIFPFGLILGYLRSKYQTLWYGIIIHFIHNFIVLMLDYYSYHSAL